MNHRIHIHLALIAGCLAYASFAAADVFMCDRAAQFGFTDSLCEKPLQRLTPFKPITTLAEEPKPSPPAAWMERDEQSNPWPNAFGQANTHWTGQWSNWTSWEHVHGWNNFQAFYPFTGRFDHDWFQLRVPHVNRRALTPGTAPERRTQRPAP